LINRNNALNYINGLNSGGGTNISGALSTAISQYADTDQSTANIIIFFTDGQATAGITNTDGILQHVRNELESHDTKINLFSFGIGSSANQQLLTLLATENNGMARFLANNELETEITKFYLEIQNPVLLDTKINFSSDDITEVFPRPLPSLYKGQQMIVSGRYSIPGNLEITLTGHALGNPVEYKYNLSLSDSTISENQFLTKIWAKQKIEDLTVRYYSLDFNSTQADSIKEEILTLSIAYGIITEFTSFTEDPNPDLDATSVEFESSSEAIEHDFKLLGNYPNPFNPSTHIKFSVGVDYSDVVKIRIYNSLGELVRELSINVTGRGIYEITWDGLNSNNELVPSDMYIYTIDFGQHILAGKMILIK
jgi:Ca-activated chloride channel family protein